MQVKLSRISSTSCSVKGAPFLDSVAIRIASSMGIGTATIGSGSARGGSGGALRRRNGFHGIGDLLLGGSEQDRNIDRKAR